MNKRCYHCQAPLSEGCQWQSEVLGQTRSFCCPTCQAVSQAIVDGGMDNFYRFRTAPADTPSATDENQPWTIYDHPQIQRAYVANNGNNSQASLAIDGINCPACGWLLEKHLGQIDGVIRIGVNVAARRATVCWVPEKIHLSQLLQAINQIGYQATPLKLDGQDNRAQQRHKQLLKKLGLAGILTMQLMMLAIALYFDVFGTITADTQQFFHLISLILCMPVVIYSGSEFYRGAWRALLQGKLNMDVPITIAILATFVASTSNAFYQQGNVYFESVAMLIFLLLIGRFLEQQGHYKATVLATNSIKHLPQSALLYQQGHTTEIPAEQLTVGQQVLVKPGATIPADGVIFSGRSDVNEALLNGEFEPVTKCVGAPVYGGSVNGDSMLVVTITQPVNDAAINQILRQQELAMADKPRIASQAQRGMQYFVAAVLVLAAGGYLFWHFYQPQKAFEVAIAVLVATCPCALGLAIPTALSAALSALSSKGIVLKRADVLNNMTQIDQLVVDKTGTLTQGNYRLQRTVSLDGSPTSLLNKLAASLEQISEHPLAAAFGHISEKMPVVSPKAVNGGGVEGTINGHCYRLGNSDFIGHNIPADYQDGQIFMSRNGQLIGVFYLQDTLRPDADQFIQAFQHLPVQIISGDNTRQVRSIAEKLAISDWHGNCSAADKTQRLKQMQQQGKQVLMVGDGINDGPVMAVANISVTLASATDMAKTSADVLLLNNRLSSLQELLDISIQTQRIIQQNLLWALIYNLLVLPLALAGWLTPWMAVIGMSSSSVLVISNSLRLFSLKRSI